METYKLIPNNNANWSITPHGIYYNYYCKILLLQKISGKIWIVLDDRCWKQVAILAKHLNKMNVDFYFNSKRLSFNSNIDSPESKKIIIKSYLGSIMDPDFFKKIKKIGFDYVENLSKYLQEFDCMDIFDEVYKDVSSKIYVKIWNRSPTYEYLHKEEIRDMINGLQREVKLNILSI